MDETSWDDSDSTGTDVCPYPGLAPFSLAEARWFFGRKPDIDTLVDLLGARLDDGVPIAVVAPSGAGKSSLLAAGLVPALADGALPGSQHWPVVVTTPGPHPLTTLADSIAELIGTDRAEVAVAIANPEHFAAYLTSHGDRQRETGRSAPAVLIVDQFEEIFAECREPERQAFVVVLCTAARSAAILVVIGVRADFYGSCMAYPTMVPALRNQVLLEPICTDQLRSIITGPAEAEDFEVEPGLVELLLRELGVDDGPGVVTASYDPGALPLLAHTLRAVWQRRSGRLLTVAGYRRTGGLREAIATSAEGVYTRLNEPERQIAQQLLVRLVQVSEQTRALRRRVPRERLIQALPGPAEETEQILEIFGRARMLTLDRTSVELSHEALLWAWPRLAGWINSDPAGLRIHQRLSDAAVAWKTEGRDPALLYRDRPLAIAQDWAASPGSKDKLSELDTAYLQASTQHAQREQQAERHRTRRLRILVGVLAMALVVALLAGTVAIQLYHLKDEQSLLANAKELAIASQSVGAARPEIGMMLAVAAYRMAKNEPKTISALLSAQSRYFAGPLIDHSAPVNTVKFSPDGRTVATGSDDGALRLWNVADRHLIAPLLDHGSVPVDDVEFSNNGLTLAAASRDGTVRLWDVTEKKPGASLHRPDVPGVTGRPEIKTLSSMTFSHDDKILATSDDDEAQLWDTADGRLIASLKGSRIKKVEFSESGSILAAVGTDELVSLWKIDEKENPKFLGRTGNQSRTSTTSSDVLSVAFSPDAHTLAIGSFDSKIRLWKVENPTDPVFLHALTGPSGSIDSVAFSRDSNTVFASSSDGTAWLWDLAGIQKIGRKIFTANNAAVGGNIIKNLAFNRDASIMASIGDDRRARLWDMRGLIPIKTKLRGMKFSPDGRFFAVPNLDRVQLWNTFERRQIEPVGGAVMSMAFSKNSNVLVTAETNGIVRLSDIINHQPPVELPNQIIRTTAGTAEWKVLAFSPREEILAIADNSNKTLQLWNTTRFDRPEMLKQLALPAQSFIKTMTFSRSGRILATAGIDNSNSANGGFAKLWDIANPHSPKLSDKTLDFSKSPKPSAVKRVAFNSDDSILMTVEESGAVLRWSVDAGQLLSAPKIFDFPGATVRAIELDLDGETLATAVEGGAGINIWDMKTVQWDMDNVSKPLLSSVTLDGDNEGILPVALSRNGHFLATLGNDNIVRIWDLDPKSVATRYCDIIGVASNEQKEQLKIFASVGFPDDICN